MKETEIKGISTELLCQNAFISAGYSVSVPLNSEKYDFIADIHGILLRIQVKSCVEKDNCITIPTRSTHLSSNGSVSNRYSKDDVDMFATFYNGNCYLIPIEYQNSAQISLFKSKPCGINKYLSLHDFELRNIIDTILCDEPADFLETVKVQQYDLMNNLIAEYDSCADAAMAIGKCGGRGHIVNCAQGKRETAYGYKWKYKQ